MWELARTGLTLISFVVVSAVGACSPTRNDRAHDEVAAAKAESGRVAVVSPPTAVQRSAAEHGALARSRGGSSPIPFAECEASEVDPALDEAGRAYQAGDFVRAHACADLAADLSPQAVAAHHLRAAALSALGRHELAQVAFAMALALDPDDPETLAAAADFYINALVPKHRDNVQVGLEYAGRGSSRVATRRHVRRSLQARLFLLEAQGHNDLGRADIALPRTEEALGLAPSLVEARHERGVSLFNLCRFDQAEREFSRVLQMQPNDPYAHHHLGQIYERAGRDADAEAHFARARELAPTEFFPAVEISDEEFALELQKAVDEQPPQIRALLDGVEVGAVDFPALEDLRAVDPPFAPTIMGLFRGLPAESDSDVETGHVPGSKGIPQRAILLFRNNLARAVRTRSELSTQIVRTLVHEIGHLRGLDEHGLRARGLE